MSFSIKLKETPQSLLEEQKKIGARLIMTIPYGCPVEKMQGFVSIMGGYKNNEEGILPVLTICLQNPSSSATVSTIVFKGDEHYIEFVEKLATDAYMNYKKEDELEN